MIKTVRQFESEWTRDHPIPGTSVWKVFHEKTGVTVRQMVQYIEPYTGGLGWKKLSNVFHLPDLVYVTFRNENYVMSPDVLETLETLKFLQNKVDRAIGDILAGDKLSPTMQVIFDLIEQDRK